MVTEKRTYADADKWTFFSNHLLLHTKSFCVAAQKTVILIHP